MKAFIRSMEVLKRPRSSATGGEWLLVVLLAASQLAFSMGATSQYCVLNSTVRQLRDIVVRNLTEELINNVTSNVTKYLLQNTKSKNEKYPLTFNMTASLWQTVNSSVYLDLPNMVLRLGLPAWFNNSGVNNYTFINGNVSAQKWTGSVWNVPLTWKEAMLTLPEYIQHGYIYRLHEQLELLAQRTFFQLGAFSFPRSFAYSGLIVTDNNWNVTVCQATEGFSFTVLLLFNLNTWTANIREQFLRTDIERQVDGYAADAFGAYYLQSNLSAINWTPSAGYVNASVNLYFSGSYEETPWAPDNLGYVSSVMSGMTEFHLFYHRINASLLVPPRVTECNIYLLAQNQTSYRQLLEFYTVMPCPNISTTTSTPFTSLSTQYEINETTTASAFTTFVQNATTTTSFNGSMSSLAAGNVSTTITSNKQSGAIATGNASGTTAPRNSAAASNASLTSNATSNDAANSFFLYSASVIQSPGVPIANTSMAPATTIPSTVINLSTVWTTGITNQSSTTVPPKPIPAPTSTNLVKSISTSVFATTTTASQTTTKLINNSTNGTLAPTSTSTVSATSTESSTPLNSTITTFPSTTTTPKTTDAVSTSVPSLTVVATSSITSNSVTTLASTVANTTFISTPTAATIATTPNQTTPEHTTPKNQTSSTKSSSSVKPTKSPPHTTFDVDPFFKAVVPVVTKIYNDKTLLRVPAGTMIPITQKSYFYTIAIPSAAGIIICALLCLFWWQVDWAPANYNKK